MGGDRCRESLDVGTKIYIQCHAATQFLSLKLLNWRTFASTAQAFKFIQISYIKSRGVVRMSGLDVDI